MAVEEGPLVVTVQFGSKSEGFHSMLRSSRSDSVSPATIRNKATWSSFNSQTPIESAVKLLPPYQSSGYAKVGAMFKTFKLVETVVVSPSSSVATAVMLRGPSPIGVKVHVG